MGLSILIQLYPYLLSLKQECISKQLSIHLLLSAKVEVFGFIIHEDFVRTIELSIPAFDFFGAVGPLLNYAELF